VLDSGLGNPTWQLGTEFARFETDHFYFKTPEHFFGRDAFEYLEELKTIKEMGFSDYFLIVADFVGFGEALEHLGGH
jgi:DNA polymerase III alpha subunit